MLNTTIICILKRVSLLPSLVGVQNLRSQNSKFKTTLTNRQRTLYEVSRSHPPGNAHQLLHPQTLIPPTCRATSKDSAWNAAVDKPPGLCQWSDVLWLGWVHYTTPEQLSKLRHIAQRNVVSTSTQQVLARVLRKHWPDHETCKTGKAPAWPGKVITPDMEGFAALLGTNSLWGR